MRLKNLVSRILYKLYGIQETAANQVARSSGLVGACATTALCASSQGSAVVSSELCNG